MDADKSLEGLFSFLHTFVDPGAVLKNPGRAVPVSKSPEPAKVLQFSQKAGKKVKSVPTKQRGSNTDSTKHEGGDLQRARKSLRSNRGKKS